MGSWQLVTRGWSCVTSRWFLVLLTVTQVGGQCVRSCVGLPNGDYQSCHSCHVYVSCHDNLVFDGRPCPDPLVWNDILKVCDYSSPTCGGPPGVVTPWWSPGPGGFGTPGGPNYLAYNCAGNNPCFAGMSAPYHFAYTGDHAKFVQCSEHGQCYVQSCAPGTSFDVFSRVCAVRHPLFFPTDWAVTPTPGIEYNH